MTYQQDNVTYMSNVRASKIYGQVTGQRLLFIGARTQYDEEKLGYRIKVNKAAAPTISDCSCVFYLATVNKVYLY